MLGKLIRHEWRATWKVVILINLFLVVLTVLGVISFASKLWTVDNIFIQLTGMSSLFMYYITLIGIVFAVTIYLYVHFYKNTYSAEGYLMHTLPVTPRQLIVSKLFLGSCYVLLTICNIIVSVFLLLFSAATALGFFEVNLNEMINAFKTEIIPIFQNEFGISITPFILFFIISLVLGSIANILLGYASISLGQLFAKHKILGSFLAYFGVQMLMQFLSVFISTPLFTYSMFENNFVPKNFMWMMFGGTTIFSLILCIILYIITEVTMSKKLNLD